MPEFLFGAYLQIYTALSLIYACLNLIVAQVPNATLNDELGKSMLLGCADAAEMDSLPKKIARDIIFICSGVIIFDRKCAFYSSSICNILAHQQLNSKKLIDHLKFVLNDRFTVWISSKEKGEFDIEFVDMHDTKFTYCMLQCSGWARKHQTFCACKCRCGEGSIAGNIYKILSAEEYRSLYKKSEDRMNSQKKSLCDQAIRCLH